MLISLRLWAIEDMFFGIVMSAGILSSPVNLGGDFYFVSRM